MLVYIFNRACNSGNSLGDEGARALAAVLAQTRLNILSVSRSLLIFANVDALIGQTLTRARNCFSDNGIGDEGARAIAAVLPDAYRLASLYMRSLFAARLGQAQSMSDV